MEIQKIKRVLILIVSISNCINLFGQNQSYEFRHQNKQIVLFDNQTFESSVDQPLNHGDYRVIKKHYIIEKDTLYLFFNPVRDPNPSYWEIDSVASNNLASNMLSINMNVRLAYPEHKIFNIITLYKNKQVVAVHKTNDEGDFFMMLNKGFSDTIKINAAIPGYKELEIPLEELNGDSIDVKICLQKEDQNKLYIRNSPWVEMYQVKRKKKKIQHIINIDNGQVFNVIEAN